MASLKVLLIGPSTSKSRGGIATVINDIINAKEKRDIEFRHIVSHVEENIVQKLIVFFKSLINIYQEKSVDIFHIHVASSVSIFRKCVYIHIGSLLKKPVLLHVHGSDFDTYFNNSPNLIKKFIIKAFSKCARILVLSEYWKTYFEVNLPHPRVEIIHNGVYLDDFNDCHTQQNFSNYLFLGKLCQRKGVYDLLEAINILVNNWKVTDLKFYLAGNGDIEQVKRIISQYNLTPYIILTGWLTKDKIKQLLKQIDTLILPSYAEGLPMAIMEAMAAGKVIISTNIGGIPDVVGNENGFLIIPGDIESLCKHILYIHTHPQNMISLSLNNIKKISEDYNLSVIHTQLFEIYYSLVNVTFPENYVESKTVFIHVN